MATNKKEYARRGFDIEVKLYNKFRALAVEAGENTKDFLARAIKNEIKRVKSAKRKVKWKL